MRPTCQLLRRGTRRWDGAPTNAEGQRRASRTAGGPEGAARRFVDRSQSDRPLHYARRSRVDDSGVYGAAYDITQAPGVVVIRTEMIHEARVILLDGLAAAPAFRQLMGCPRPVGRQHAGGYDDWLRRPRRYRGSGDCLTMTERFTRSARADSLEVRFEDPAMGPTAGVCHAPRSRGDADLGRVSRGTTVGQYPARRTRIRTDRTLGSVLP